MKLRLTLILLACLIAGSVEAQKLGLKAGLSLSKAHYEYSETSITTTNLTGMQVGLIAELPISKAVYCSTGLLYSQKGTKFSLMGVEVEFPINYFEIPLNFEYKYDLGSSKIFAQAGPYAGIGLSAKMKGGGDTETMDFGSDIDQIKKLDIGLNFGAGLEIKKVQVGINYGFGFVNLSNDPDESFKNGALTFSVAFLFGNN